MDNMLEHPWTELQLLIKEKWLTQKAFSSILWKKVSEVNELLKWKRNITIQRDYLLHQTLWTPIKYWILKQIDYDYSLLDIKETTSSPLLIGEGQGEVSSHQTSHSEPEWRENPSNITPMDFSLQSKWQEKPEDEVQVAPLWDWKSRKSSLPGGDLDGAVEEKEEIWNDSKDDEDLKNRAKIFRTF